MSTVDNVTDRRRHGWIGTWEVEPLYYSKLTQADIGRTVIYLKTHGGGEAGTITSWRDGVVFAHYSSGDHAAGASPENLVFGIRPLPLTEVRP